MEDNSGRRKSSSNPTSRPSSVGPESRKSRSQNKVKFSLGGEDDPEEPEFVVRKPLPGIRLPSGSKARDPREFNPNISEDVAEHFSAFRWGAELEKVNTIDKESSALSAQERASRLASRVTRSAPASRRNSFESGQSSDQTLSLSPSAVLSPIDSPLISGNTRGNKVYPVRVDDIPLVDLNRRRSSASRPYSIYDDTTDEDSDHPEQPDPPKASKPSSSKNAKSEALRLVRAFTQKMNMSSVEGSDFHIPQKALDQQPKYKIGILTSLLQLTGGSGTPLAHNARPKHNRKSEKAATHNHSRSISENATGTYSPVSSAPSSPTASGRATPKRAKWYKSPAHSTSSFSQLLPTTTNDGVKLPARSSTVRPGLPRSKSTSMIASAVQKITGHSREPRQLEQAIEISVHIAAVIERQRYLVQICRALMLYGAPTHRLEQYLKHSARALQINGQFMYLPGCMLLSFDDEVSHTAEVKLVKENQAVDLARFQDVFEIYKNVIHDVTGVTEAMEDLNEVMHRKPQYPVWVRILMYGLASVCVGPFAFDARPTDWPICFLLGCMLGLLQLVCAEKSDEFLHVFEISAAILTSFLARAFGSISVHGQHIFCFSAIAQSSIALILPGYVILCGSLELQSKNIVAGSVRMVYAIIFALFLGFGITIGTALYGLMDRNAVSVVTCANPDYFDWWTNNVYLSHFPFVPLFALCLIIINQGTMKQAPVMVGIAFAGYQVNYWSGLRFANNVQIANALGAFAIGSLANMYSRLFHGLAAAALLPAIFVQVPSGLAASGSLVAGLTSAQQITGSAEGVSVITNGTQGFIDASNSTGGYVYSGTIFNVGYGMVQVAIGISVGLFLSALFVYPFGKKRSAIFSF